MCELTNGKCLGGEARKSEYWHVSATALAWWQRDTQAEASPIDNVSAFGMWPVLYAETFLVAKNSRNQPYLGGEGVRFDVLSFSALAPAIPCLSTINRMIGRYPLMRRRIKSRSVSLSPTLH
jgi:hypothetical protein